jgi:hypothetical protein
MIIAFFNTEKTFRRPAIVFDEQFLAIIADRIIALLLRI